MQNSRILLNNACRVRGISPTWPVEMVSWTATDWKNTPNIPVASAECIKCESVPKDCSSVESPKRESRDMLSSMPVMMLMLSRKLHFAKKSFQGS